MAHCVALLLLGFVRSMIDGPTPLHLIEKPTPGTGATLMVDSISTILTGSGVSVMTEGRDDEEWRKRVTAKLRQVPSILLIDNLRSKLDSSAVAAALTAPFWEDRILGASEMARLPIRCVWIATGNNPEFSNEMARRLVRIRLDAHLERPWQRAEFRHPDLNTWVRANRGRLVAACLTLCQAWIARGRPRGGKSIGSYENWAGVIGGILETAGIPGFLGNLEEMMAAADAEGDAWTALITAWWDRFGTAEVGTADLFELALACDPPLRMSGQTEQARRTSLGGSIKRMRDRIFKVGEVSLRLSSPRRVQGALRWQLEFVARSEASTSESKAREPLGNNVSLQNRGSRSEATEITDEREPREPREPLLTLTHARAHAHDIERSGKGSQGSRGPQTQVKSDACDGEPQGEPAEVGPGGSRTPSGRIRAPWELPPEPSAPPPDTTRKKMPRSPVFKDQELPGWLAEIME
jgi:hypothetical protein